VFTQVRHRVNKIKMIPVLNLAVWQEWS
jgi:hypothetical protein